MAFEGMDPVVVRNIAAKLDIEAKAVATVLTVLQQQVDRARSAWQGPAASHFEASWNSEHKQSLVGAHEQLSTMAALLTSEANAQDKTSEALDGPGGGSGALPVGGPGGGSGGPGEKPDPKEDPWELFDTIGEGPALAGLIPAGFEGAALYRLAAAGFKLGANGRAASAAYDAALLKMYSEGKLTQSQIGQELRNLTAEAKPEAEALGKEFTEATEAAGKDGGLSVLGKYGDTVGKAGGVLAVAGDVMTLVHPGGTGNQPTERRVAAGLNIAGTAAAFAPDAALAALNVSVDWVPVAGQVVALGTAAYLAYEQVPFIHDSVNWAAGKVAAGTEWLADEQLKLETAAVHGVVNVATDAYHGAEQLTGDAVQGVKNVASGAEHVAGSVVHAGGSVVKKISSWL